MNLISIDPGNNTGWAVFHVPAPGTTARLLSAGVEKKADLFHPTSPRIPGGIILASATLVLIELPQHVKVPVMDLITLAVGVGEIKRFYEAQSCRVELVWPRTWKGTVPTPVHNKRVLAALTPEELALLPRRPRAKDVDHNCVDAVGLGLWKLRRLR